MTYVHQCCVTKIHEKNLQKDTRVLRDVYSFSVLPNFSFKLCHDKMFNHYDILIIHENYSRWKRNIHDSYSTQCSVSRKSRNLYGPEKPFLRLRLAHSVKLVFSYVVKGRRIKITAKFRTLKRLCFEDSKRTMSPGMSPKSFGTFEKRTPGPCIPF